MSVHSELYLNPFPVESHQDTLHTFEQFDTRFGTLFTCTCSRGTTKRITVTATEKPVFPCLPLPICVYIIYTRTHFRHSPSSPGIYLNPLFSDRTQAECFLSWDFTLEVPVATQTLHDSLPCTLLALPSSSVEGNREESYSQATSSALCLFFRCLDSLPEWVLVSNHKKVTLIESLDLF